MPADVTTLSREELLERYLQHERLIVDRDRELAERDHQLAERERQLCEHQQKISEQKFLIERLQRMLFGSKRERFTVPDGQQVLPFVLDTERVADAVEQEQAKITVEYTRSAGTKHPGRLPLPEHLDVVTIVHEPECDTTGMKRIGQETSDELGFTPAKFFIRRHIRPKYITPENDELQQSVLIAELPPRPIDKCEASAELLAEIIIEKHVYHVPVYRQLERFAALGVRLPSSTVENWQRMTGLLLRPLYAVLRVVIGQATYLQVDESPIAVQDRTLEGTTHRGWMWCYHAVVDQLIYFDYQRGRGTINCKAMLEHFRGYLQSDGYAAYNEHKAREGIIPLACWAHVRRKFFDARSNDEKRADAALTMIAKLYDVERQAREGSLPAEERKTLRLEHSLPLTNAFGAWLVKMLDETTPKSPIGVAVRYAVSLWSELENYLHDGHLEIDNNLTENAIRPLALGRKNYLFAGSHDAAVNIAMYRSFFATCRLHEIDPRAWLTHVLTAIRTTPAEEYHTLLPHKIDREKLG